MDICPSSDRADINIEGDEGDGRGISHGDFRLSEFWSFFLTTDYTELD